MSEDSHAYVDGSFVALCGYLRGAREPMDESKPRCLRCAKAVKFAETEYQRGLREGAASKAIGPVQTTHA